MSRTRLSTIVLAVVLLVGAAAVWRGATVPPARVAPQRGGQVVATLRGEPRSFNRLVGREQGTETVALLTQGRLVRIERRTFELEPWLAERWESTPDGLTHTFHLRRDVTWSDGEPFTSADVLFSVEAIFTMEPPSVLASALTIGGKPIRAAAPDTHTVVITYPEPFGPGVRLIDNLWILPKHKLEPALRAGTLAQAWSTSTPPSEIVGTGPFVIASVEPGQRVVFERNPRYWRTAPEGGALPYLERLVLEIVPDENAQILRLESGATDLAGQELRPDDYAVVKRAADQGRLRLLDVGVGTDADAFWFCLKPEAKKDDPRFAFVQRPEFRQAISHAVNREAFAETVFLGAAVPIWGPITPGNVPWFTPDLPRYPYDVDRARELLRGLGLEDRDGNGVVEDARGVEARFTVITQRGVTAYERGTAFLRDELAKVGIRLDIAPLEFNAMIGQMLASKYDAMYFRPLFSDLDPALALDFWLSSGSGRYWNFAQDTPATEWERQIDVIMREQASTIDPSRRRELFNQAQRIFAENLPVLHFAAPRIYYVHAARVQGVRPSVLRPQALWDPDMLSVVDSRAETN